MISILAIQCPLHRCKHQSLHPCGHQASTGHAAPGGLPRRLTAVLVTLGDKVGGPTFGGTPVSLLAVIVLFGVILRRARQSAAVA